MGDLDLRSLRGDHGAFQLVDELPDVPRPLGSSEGGQGLAGEAVGREREPGADSLQQPSCDEGNVLAAVSQRRQPKSEHAQSVIEVAAEASCADRILETGTAR